MPGIGQTRAKACLGARGDWINGVIDPASLGSSQIDGRTLMDIYMPQLSFAPESGSRRESVLSTFALAMNCHGLTEWPTITVGNSQMLSVDCMAGV